MKPINYFKCTVLLVCLVGYQTSFAGWQTQKTHWPRIMYKSSDMPVIKAHYDAAQKSVEPYKTLWERIQKKANSPLRLDNKEWGAQNTNANIVKACAFIYAVTGDKTLLDKIRDELTTFYTGKDIPEYSITSFSISKTKINNLKSTILLSIHMAQSLTIHLQAYDILKGAGYDFGPAEKTVLTNLGTLAKRLYDISNWISSGSKIADLLVEDVEEQNNFQLKITSALGLAAICLNNDASAQKWIDRSMTKFWQVFNAQTTPKGGYGEGPFYFVYAGLNFLPFFQACNLFMDGQGGTFDSHKIPNFFSNDRVISAFDWHIKIRMPNGDRPGYDDGYYSGFPGGFLVMSSQLAGSSTIKTLTANSGLYAWDWFNTEKMEGGNENRLLSEFANLDLTVDIFCHYDQSIIPTEPKIPPTQFLPEAGNAVFRSGWDKNAVYLNLLGENGPMRTKGGVHEHPDAGSYVLYAYGELLALDAGYPGYPQHDLVNQAKNHNVLLVDNNGPKTDAFLGEFIDTPVFDCASVRMSYGDADIIRTIYFIDNQYFIINDKLNSSTIHTYSWLLHGYAGADVVNSSFAITATGGVWQRPKAKLEANVFGFPRNPIYENDTDYHSFTFAGKNQLPKHSVLRVKQSGANVLFASLVYPAPSDRSIPSVRQLKSDNGIVMKITGDDGEWLINAGRGASENIQVNSEIASIGVISTDAEIAIVGQKTSSEPMQILYIKNGLSISFANDAALSANKKCHFVLTYNSNTKDFNGYFDGTPGTTVRLKWMTSQRQASGVKGIAYQQNSKTLQLDFDKSGYFRIY